MNRVFIGYDPRQPVAFQVCAQSVWDAASKPVEIIRLDLRTLPLRRVGLTEFTYSRFLVPFLCGFEGHALFLDSDILVRGDIAGLFDAAERFPQCDVMMVKSQLKFEWPSVMMFNCAECGILTPDYVSSAKLFDYAWVKNPGWIAPEWNHLVGYDEPNPNAMIVHFTKGIPVWEETRSCEFAGEWRETHMRTNSTVSHGELMGRSVHVQRKAVTA